MGTVVSAVFFADNIEGKTLIINKMRRMRMFNIRTRYTL